MVSFFPNCFSRQKTLHQHQLPPIIPSFFRLAFQGEGALVLATTLYLEATLIIVVRSRTTAHETKVKAKLIARARVHHPHHHAGTFPLSYQESFRKSMAAAFGDRALTEAVPVGPGCRRRRPQQQYGKTCRNNSGRPTTARGRRASKRKAKSLPELRALLPPGGESSS